MLWQVPDAGVEDAQAAAQAAWRAFHETQWSTDTALRADVVGRLQRALAAHGRTTSRCSSPRRPACPSRSAQAHLDAPIAGMPGRPAAAEPAGVTAVVTPATSPLAVAIAEVGRVLVAGGTVVLKPAPEAASAALELGRIALDIVPRGVLNVVSTRDVDVAIALTLDHRIDEISFTGAAVTGERVRSAGERAGKRVRLDVGGPLSSTRRRRRRPRRRGRRRLPLAVAANAGQACRLPASVVVPAHRYDEAVRTRRRDDGRGRRSATRPSPARSADPCARWSPGHG